MGRGRSTCAAWTRWSSSAASSPRPSRWARPPHLSSLSYSRSSFPTFLRLLTHPLPASPPPLPSPLSSLPLCPPHSLPAFPPPLFLPLFPHSLPPLLTLFLPLLPHSLPPLLTLF